MPSRRSVDASRFAMIPRGDIPRSAFDVVTTHKTTFDAGLLIPVYVDEVLPGDTVRLRMTAFCRLATPIVPVMDNLTLESFFFFVPNRLLWDNWTRFMGEQLSPTDTTNFLTPYVVIDNVNALVCTLADYFGLQPCGAGDSYPASALPFRAYNQIWNAFFRDQDLQTPQPELTDDGPDTLLQTSGNYFLYRRGKRHDYFTSARPWPQKPINQVAMSDLGGLMGPFAAGHNMTLPQAGVPVTGLGLSVLTPTGATGTQYETGNRSGGWAHGSPSANMTIRQDANGYPDVRVLINDLRTANAVQILMEKQARGGTRYTELVREQFGVVSPDARLQRPEYLGGGRAVVTVSPIAQTSASGVAGTSTVLGELAGIGTVVASNHGFSQSFTEHGWIIGLVSVRADLTYQQGVNRMWFRRTKFDFYTPALAFLGEQPILSKEIYAVGTADDDLVFGYQERWAEYRFKPGRISGRFKSTSPSPLDVWHFAQVFASRPVLNAAFIQEDPPVDRVLQVGGQDNEQFLFDSVFDVRMVRPLPMFSIPGLGPRL